MYYQDDNGNIVLKKKLKKSNNKTNINNNITIKTINSMSNNKQKTNIPKKKSSTNIQKTNNIKKQKFKENLKLKKSSSNTYRKVIYSANKNKVMKKNNTAKDIQIKKKLLTEKNKINNNVKYINDRYLKMDLFKIKQNEIFFTGTVSQCNQELNLENKIDINYIPVKTNNDEFIINENKNKTKKKIENENKMNGDVKHENGRIIIDEDYENENDFGVVYIK